MTKIEPLARLGLLASALPTLILFSIAAPPAAARALDCTTDPPGAPPFTVELVRPDSLDGVTRSCALEVQGRVLLQDARGWDVYIVVDSSGSTAGASGLDLDGDGVVGDGDWRNNDDPDDSTLAAELEAVRRALDAWEGLDVRVSLEEYSAVVPIPPGEVEEQGRIRTVQGLTRDFDAIRRGLAEIDAAGSVGATDYGGALFELAAEYDRSGDPERRPVAFFLSDGKPTFPRFPFDVSEVQDVQWAMEGAVALADRGLPVNTLEIGIFDDLGTLARIASRTHGTLLPGLIGADILDAIASLALDGFAYVEMTNESSGEQSYATLEPDGQFTGEVPLAHGRNEVVFRAVLRTTEGEFAVSCPVSVDAWCFDVTAEQPEVERRTPEERVHEREEWWRPKPFFPRARFDKEAYEFEHEIQEEEGDREEYYIEWHGGGGHRGGIRFERRTWHERWPETTERLRRWDEEPCPALRGEGELENAECNEALRQLTALLLSVEHGELSESCRLDPDVVPDHDDVGDLIRELERALDRDRSNRCRRAAEAAELVTSGVGLAEILRGPDPSGPASFSCETVQDDTEFDVSVELESPEPGAVFSDDECPARVRIEGSASARGSTAIDVYFVVDSSGSTAGDSGRDLDGDGTNETTLEAELAAVRAFVESLDPALVRVALVEFSAVIPIPPGEPNEQGRIRTVHPLSNDYAAFFESMNTITQDGSVGATDYGGALLELAAEYDRHGDPTRGHVAFFMSDGKPTFPRFPYDSQESPDTLHALDGARACADRGIAVNTYEVGVFDELSTLQAVSELTGGRFYPALEGGAIVDALPGSTLVGIERVEVRNVLTGDVEEADLAPDGAWEADVPLAPGENAIEIVVTSDNGAEVVRCSTTFVGECAVPECAVRSPESWHDDCP